MQNEHEITSISNQVAKEVNSESIVVDEIKRIKERSRKRVSFAHIEPIQNHNYSIVEQSRPVIHDDWATMDENERVSYIVFIIFKIILILLLLYAFLVSLGLLTIGFTLASNFQFESSAIFDLLTANFLCMFTLGIVFTALIQNSTVVTSIAITLIGTGILKEVRQAVPLLMGAHIGACMKNLLVASSLGEGSVLKRAFTAATLNDGFNFFTVALLMPLEVGFGFMRRIAQSIVNYMVLPIGTSKNDMALLNAASYIISPITENFIVLNATASLRCCGSLDVTSHFLNIENAENMSRK